LLTAPDTGHFVDNILLRRSYIVQGRSNIVYIIEGELYSPYIFEEKLCCLHVTKEGYVATVATFVTFA
jgi:hypothetical protein